MRPGRTFLLCLILVNLAHWQTYGQTAIPGCTTPYYKGNYSPPLDGSVGLQSMAQSADACVYLGCTNNQTYSIIKLDSFGNMIRSTSYTPSGFNTWNPPGKTIVDADGNLFSVIFNNYILKTDTAGNILSGKQMSFFGNISGFNLADLGMLANGDKVFLYAGYDGGYEDEFVVVTSPDASVILWTKYLPGWTYSNSSGCILADGNKVIVALNVTGSVYYPNGSVIFALDGGTGTVLQQRWFSQILTFNHISRYNTGYIFSGDTYAQSNLSFYVRTDTSLNTIAVNSFPAYSISWPYGFPFIFQAQADGSVYGFYSGGSMTLFLISPGDAIQWASGLFGFYQVPVALVLNPTGIFIGTDWTATDVITGGTISAMQLYKSSYSGYFPPCTNPTPATMQMASYALTPTSPIISIRDTTGVSISTYTLQPITGPTLVGNTCTGTPSCNNLQITGTPNVCTGSGTFTGVTNGGCSLPLTWSVTGGPGTASIQSLSNNGVSISFSQDGIYQVKALVSTNCTNFGDSLLVHVSSGAHLSLGNDTTLCAGNSLVLHAGNNFSSYTWQDGSTDSTLLVTTPGQYTITAVDYCGNSSSSSINVSFLPPLTNPFATNVTKCPDDTLSVAVPSGFDSVYFLSPAVNARIWNDSIQFFNPGVASYTLQERDDHGCTVNSTIAVQVYAEPPLQIGDDTTICAGDSVLLDAGTGFNSYEWSTGSQNQAIWAVAGGSYWVHAAANGCILRDSMVLATWPIPVVNLDADTLLCTGTTKVLSAGSGFVSYLWNDGQTAATLSVSSPGQYWVAVTDVHGCSAADTVNMVEKPCLTGLYIPNAFTPNNDGKNDVFRPLIYGNVVQYKFTVFNRWGQEVFESAEPMKGWDGTIRGTPQPDGAYVWYCRYQLQGEAVQTQRGTVLLIR
jgi:gliding motility-associated-like protein